MDAGTCMWKREECGVEDPARKACDMAHHNCKEKLDLSACGKAFDACEKSAKPPRSDPCQAGYQACLAKPAVKACEAKIKPCTDLHNSACMERFVDDFKKCSPGCAKAMMDCYTNQGPPPPNPCQKAVDRCEN